MSAGERAPLAPREKPGGPVLVTGGTGFLGREIVGQLVADGIETHVLARPSSQRGPLESQPVTWHAGDLLDPGSIERAVAHVAGRADAAGGRPRVIHAAALISYRTRDREAALAINVGGTVAMLEAAERHEIARFLHVSSVVTVGHCEGPTALDETARWNNGDLAVDYVDTKRTAEERVLAAAPVLDTVVVNPGAIFGPVERASNTVRLIRRIAQGRAPPFAPPGSVGVVGVRDAAKGARLALEHGRRGERYLLVESNLSAAELIGRIAAQLGVRSNPRVLPRRAWGTLTRLASAWDLVFPLQLTPPQALTMLGLALRFDAGKARRELGWSPHPFEDVLAETIEILCARGALTRIQSRSEK